MKRLLKSWVFWVFAVPGVLIAAAVLLHVESVAYDCACDSAKSMWRLHVGVGSSVRPIWTRESETPSAFHRDILVSRHRHAWRSTNSSFISLSGHGRISCGIGHAGPLAWVYDRDPAFQAWLKVQVADGVISGADIDRELAKTVHYPKGQYPFGWTPP